MQGLCTQREGGLLHHAVYARFVYTDRGWVITILCMHGVCTEKEVGYYIALPRAGVFLWCNNDIFTSDVISLLAWLVRWSTIIP